MDAVEAICNRRSTRGFKSDPVPKETIKKILETSLRIPSAMNSQPCGVTVVSGSVLQQINDGNMEKLAAGEKPTPDIKRKPYGGIFRERQKALAAQLFQLLDIKWDDKKKRMQLRRKGFRFYDAPAAFILHIDSTADQSQALISLGALCQNICLVASKFDLGTCIQDMGVAFPDVIRRYADIPASRLIVISISIGLVDLKNPVNRIEVKREPLEHMVSWLIDD